MQQLLIFFDILPNSSSQIDVVYLDFRKAFDSVVHNKLLYTQAVEFWHYWKTMIMDKSLLDQLSAVLCLLVTLPYLFSLGCHKAVSWALSYFSSL